MAEAEAKVKAVMGREKWAKSRVINGGGGGIPTQNSPKNAVVPPHIFCPRPTNNYFSLGGSPTPEVRPGQTISNFNLKFWQFRLWHMVSFAIQGLD